MNKSKSIKIIAATASLLAVITYGLFFNEARNEIYFLCGNFTEGVPYTSVTRQLDTITLSDYRIEEHETGTRITHSSQINFRLLSCHIDFVEDQVVSAEYDGIF